MPPYTNTHSSFVYGIVFQFSCVTNTRPARIVFVVGNRYQIDMCKTSKRATNIRYYCQLSEGKRETYKSKPDPISRSLTNTNIYILNKSIEANYRKRYYYLDLNRIYIKKSKKKRKCASFLRPV